MTNDNATQTTPEKPRRRWPTVLLALSLTLNLAVVGLIAGAFFRDERDARRFPEPDRSVMRATGFAPFFEAMPRDARNRMGQALRGREDQFRPDRAALAAEFSGMIAALRAEPFDPQALEAVLAQQQARAGERIAQGRAVLIAQIAEMSAAEREEFAEQLEGRFARVLDRAPMGRGPRDDD